MSYAEALNALVALEGREVYLETLVIRPANRDARPEDLQWTESGVLYDASRRPDRKRFGILPDGSGIFFWRERFKCALREGNELVIKVAAFEYRLSRLSHRDFAALSHKASPRAMEKLR